MSNQIDALANALVRWVVQPPERRDAPEAHALATTARMTPDQIIEATDLAEVRIDAWRATVSTFGKDLARYRAITVCSCGHQNIDHSNITGLCHWCDCAT